MSRTPMLSLLCLLLAALPISAQHLVVGEEIWAADPTFVPAVAYYSEAQPASNGEGYLIVWRGSRALHAQHISADGVAATPHGVVVPHTSESSWGMSVESSGADYVIVWLEAGAIWSARVSHDPSRPIESKEIASIEHAVSLELIASDHGYLLLVGKDSQDFGTDGLLLDQLGNATAAPFTIHRSELIPRSLAAASDGTDYLLAFTTNGAAGSANNVLHTRRITGSGVVHPDNRISLGPSLSFPNLGYDGSRYVALWSAGDPAREHAAMATYSAPLDPNGFFAGPPQRLLEESAILTDDAAMILFVRNDQLFALRLGPGGAPTIAQPFVVGRGSNFSGVAAGDAGHLVLWNLQYTIIPRGASDPLPLREVATRPNRHSDVRVYPLEDVQMVVWTENATYDMHEIHAARISNGQRLDGPGIHLATVKALARPWLPWLAASDGQRVLIAWRDTSEVRGLFIGANGIPSATFPLIALRPEHEQADFTALVWTGTHYGLVWSTRESASYRLLDREARFVTEGTFDLGGNNIVARDLFARTADGVAFAYDRDSDVYLARFTPSLQPIGSPELIVGTAAQELPTAIASDGQRIFISWSEGTKIHQHPAAPLAYRYLYKIVGSNETSQLAEQAIDAVWTGHSFLTATYSDPRFGRNPSGDYRPRFGSGPSGIFVAYAGSTTEYGLGDSRVAMIQKITVLPSRRRAVAP